MPGAKHETGERQGGRDHGERMSHGPGRCLCARGAWGFSEALRMEMKMEGNCVGVSCVLPLDWLSRLFPLALPALLVKGFGRQ